MHGLVRLSVLERLPCLCSISSILGVTLLIVSFFSPLGSS